MAENNNKEENKKYKNIIELVKKLKPHATDIIIFQEYVYMDSVMSWVKAFCIPDPKYIYPRFIGLGFNTYDNTPHKNFKLTKSKLDTTEKENQRYLTIENEGDEEIHQIPYITNINTRKMLENENYNSIFRAENCSSMMELLQKLAIEKEYHELPEAILDEIKNKKLCEIALSSDENNQYIILISKPLFGDLKNTEKILYKIIKEPSDDSKIFIVRFKQIDAVGTIYTYGAFLNM